MGEKKRMGTYLVLWKEYKGMKIRIKAHVTYLKAIQKNRCGTVSRRDAAKLQSITFFQQQQHSMKIKSEF